VAHLYVFVKVGTTDARSLCFFANGGTVYKLLPTEVAARSTFSIYRRPHDSPAA
jgi:hypothetical protein